MDWADSIFTIDVNVDFPNTETEGTTLLGKMQLFPFQWSQGPQFAREQLRTIEKVMQISSHPHIPRMTARVVDIQSPRYYVLKHAGIPFSTAKEKMNSTDRRTCMDQLKWAIKHLHLSNIAHGNIRIENLRCRTTCLSVVLLLVGLENAKLNATSHDKTKDLTDLEEIVRQLEISDSPSVILSSQYKQSFAMVQMSVTKKELDQLLKISTHALFVTIYGRDILPSTSSRTFYTDIHVDAQPLDKVIHCSEDYTLSKAFTWIAHIMQGLAFLRELNLVHGAIRPENLLRTSDCVKITGLDNIFTETRHTKLFYLDPYNIPYNKKSTSSDMYSLSIVIREILCRKHPGETRKFNKCSTLNERILCIGGINNLFLDDEDLPLPQFQIFEHREKLARVCGSVRIDCGTDHLNIMSTMLRVFPEEDFIITPNKSNSGYTDVLLPLSETDVDDSDVEPIFFRHLQLAMEWKCHVNFDSTSGSTVETNIVNIKECNCEAERTSTHENNDCLLRRTPLVITSRALSIGDIVNITFVPMKNYIGRIQFKFVSEESLRDIRIDEGNITDDDQRIEICKTMTVTLCRLNEQLVYVHIPEQILNSTASVPQRTEFLDLPDDFLQLRVIIYLTHIESAIISQSTELPLLDDTNRNSSFPIYNRISLKFWPNDTYAAAGLPLIHESDCTFLEGHFIPIPTTRMIELKRVEYKNHNYSMLDDIRSLNSKNDTLMALRTEPWHISAGFMNIRGFVRNSDRIVGELLDYVRGTVWDKVVLNTPINVAISQVYKWIKQLAEALNYLAPFVYHCGTYYFTSKSLFLSENKQDLKLFFPRDDEGLDDQSHFKLCRATENKEERLKFGQSVYCLGHVIWDIIHRLDIQFYFYEYTAFLSDIRRDCCRMLDGRSIDRGWSQSMFLGDRGECMMNRSLIENIKYDQQQDYSPDNKGAYLDEPEIHSYQFKCFADYFGLKEAVRSNNVDNFSKDLLYARYRGRHSIMGENTGISLKSNAGKLGYQRICVCTSCVSLSTIQICMYLQETVAKDNINMKESNKNCTAKKCLRPDDMLYLNNRHAMECFAPNKCPPFSISCDANLEAMIKRCLSEEPKDRPNFEEISNFADLQLLAKDLPLIMNDFEMISSLKPGGFAAVSVVKSAGLGLAVYKQFKDEIPHKYRKREIEGLLLAARNNLFPICHGIVGSYADIQGVLLEKMRGDIDKEIIYNERVTYGAFEIINWSHQIINGLYNLHKIGIIHRDIKPQNILVDERLENVKITDFGIMTPSRCLTDFQGTHAYMAPEVARIEEGIFNSKMDIYSFGATIYELVQRQKFTHNYSGVFVDPIRDVAQLTFLIERCCSVNPHIRPDTLEIWCNLWEKIKYFKNQRLANEIHSAPVVN